MQLAASESITLRTGVVRIEATSSGSTSAPTILFAKSSGASSSVSNTATTTDGNWVLTQVRLPLVTELQLFTITQCLSCRILVLCSAAVTRAASVHPHRVRSAVHTRKHKHSC
jgi:hypothetical protein